VDVRCSLLMLDHGVPVVIAMARGARPGDPAITVAAGAGLDAREACRHALAELAANRLFVKAEMAAAGRLPTLHDEIRDQTAHALLYARPEMAAYLDHWWSSPSTVELGPSSTPASTRDRVGQLLHQLAAARLEVIVLDITPPEIRDLGLAVARVLIPGTYPMNFDSRWPHLGGERLRTAPVTAGLREVPLPIEALNLVPHPFP
jgi:ribosomal protein S12 methylthiotransferase accessory factor